MLTLLKRYWPVLFAIAWLVTAIYVGYCWGAGDVQARWDATEAKRAEQVRAEQKRTDTVTFKSTARVAASNAAAEVRYQYIEKEVIRYVKSPAPAADCRDPEWLRLYNAGYGFVPATASGVDGTAEGVSANP